MTDEPTLRAELNEFARDQEIGWRVYERQFEREYRKPNRLQRWRFIPWGMPLFAVVGFFAALLNAERTAPVFSLVVQRFVEGTEVELSANDIYWQGLTATIVVDLAVVIFRYAIVTLQTKPRQLSRWVYIGWGVAMAVEVGANLFVSMFVITGLPEWLTTLAEVILVIIAGLAGVIVAMATGEILGHQWVQSRSDWEAAKTAYEAELDTYEELKREQWRKERGKLGIKPPGNRRGKRASQRSPLGSRVGNLSQADSQGPSQVFPIDLAIHHLRENPSHLEMSGRSLESQVFPDDMPISYRTWNKAKRHLTQNGSTDND